MAVHHHLEEGHHLVADVVLIALHRNIQHILDNRQNGGVGAQGGHRAALRHAFDVCRQPLHGGLPFHQAVLFIIGVGVRACVP